MTVQKVNTVRVFYGPRDTEQVAPSKTNKGGKTQELVVPVTYNNLPTTDATDAVIQAIPAGALIKSATLIVDEAFDSTSGTTTINIGLSELDGTVVDADGIDAAVAWDAAAGTVVLCNGADIGTIPSLTDPLQVTIVPSVADLVAGAGRLVIEYTTA